MEMFAAGGLPDVQLLQLAEERQIVFSPGNILSDLEPKLLDALLSGQ